MVSCGPNQSCKIPLKHCHGAVIDHNLVSIRLSVEWPEKGGDNPNLVIDINNKQPSTLYQSSVPINSVHHQHQHQDIVGSTYQTQYYPSPAINNYDLSSSTVASTMSDHDDVSSTTTSTLVYNSMEPELQTLKSSTAIQQIERHLRSGLPPPPQRQLILSQQYPSPQHVIQTSSANMNDSRLNMKMPTISRTSSIQPMPSMTTQFIDLQQQQQLSSLKSSLSKSLVCTCPNPTSFHVHNCAIFTSNNQESNANLSSEPQHTMPINRTNTQRPVSASQIPMNSANLLSSTKESMITTTFVPYSHSNFMNTLDSSSSVTTIISQPPSFLNNPQIGPTIKTPSMDTNNIFQHPSLNFSQVIINNQSNYPQNPSIPMPIVGQQSTLSNKPRQRKKTPKRTSSTDQDQTSSQNLNDSQEQQIHFLINQNSPTKQQNINPPPHHLSSPIQTQQETFIPQDNSQITGNTSCVSTNDQVLNTAQQQQSPRSSSMVRSPVELDISESQYLNQTKLSPEAAVEQTISDVVKGKGDIPIRNPSTPTTPQQYKRPPLSAHLVWESNGPSPTTRTFCLPLHQEQQLSTTHDSNTSTLSRQNVADITQVIRPNSTEQSQMNTVSQQPTTKNTKKRNRIKPTNNTASKRTSKTNVNIQQQQTQMSSSHQDISQTRTSPVTSTSNVMNQRMSWPDTPISSSSSGSVTNAHNVNQTQHLTNNSLEILDIDQDNDILNCSDFNEDIHIIYRPVGHGIELDDLFSQKLDRPFISSTPPPMSLPTMSTSITNQTMKSPSAEKLSNTLLGSITHPDDIFDNYFLTGTVYSSVSAEENQVTSSVLTPPDHQNNHARQQQYYSPTNTYTDSNLETKAITSRSTKTNSKIVKQMNHNDDVQTPFKRQQQQQKQKYTKTNNKSLKHPSKITKPRNRPNPIPKQTSTKPTCTRCGLKQLIDITHHEFPKQTGIVFECTSCGNNSIRSNVSADEHRRRLAKVAADHLNNVECQFCHQLFHSHNDYLTHLKDDHGSNKPM